MAKKASVSATKKIAAAKARPAAKKAAKAKPAKKSAKSATRTRPTAPRGFATLAAWRRVPLDEAEDHDFLAATNDSVGYEDCFGGDPSHVMLHEGSLRIAGLVELNGWKAARDAQQTVYIVDGDLIVDGALVFDQSDIMTTLWVTGALRATRVACASTAMLIVGGVLEVADLLITDLEDAGHLIVHGPLVAPTWIDLAQGRGCIELAHAPQTRYLSDHYAELAADGEKDTEDEREEGEAHRPGSFASAPASPALVPGLVVDERVSWRKLLDAVRKHAPILA